MFLDKSDVRRAFGEDEFFPFFQPLIELRTGQLAGFEALARWNHARLGAICPDAFISIVQSCGFIDTLTQRLLGKIFAAAPLLPSSLRLSINLSPLQLLDLTLPGRIAAAAEIGGFPLERLTIEMTEGALLEDLARAGEVAGELKALKCRLALDDFGTGYSSLMHLQALPFDELKLDRKFIRSMTQSRESEKIVGAVVGLGQSLELTTVAEGVETEEQANMLIDFGCDLAQGWHFGRPASAGEIPRMVSAAYIVCPALSAACAD
jgi:EAL domain-containing protein (putative c-di-GMP-specific phosphodiesterase class I)